jgi:EpsI family protein
VKINAHALQNATLVAVLCAAGAAAWAYQLRDPLRVDASMLDALPHELAGWVGHDIPVEETVERMLRADHNVQRTYVDPAGGLVWLYVGYYGTERGGRSEHSPFVCYPAAGWQVEDAATRTLDVPGGGRVREIRVVRDGNERLVHFWYRSHRSEHLVGDAAHAWDRFVGRLADGRADGAFVRISAPLSGVSEDSVRARLFAFGTALDDELGEHWPDETPLTHDAPEGQNGHRGHHGQGEDPDPHALHSSKKASS